MKKILLLYTFDFSGHQKACFALRRAFHTADSSLQIRVENYINLSHPVAGRWMQAAYFAGIGVAPALWGAVYDRSFGSVGRFLARRLSMSGSNRLEQVIEAFSPDAIICTQALPCIAVSELKKKRGWPGRLLYAILTDYHPHIFWSEAGEAEFIVPGEHAREVLLSRGVKASRIRVVGIPIDESFASKCLGDSRESARAALGLDPALPHILIMGGSRGLVDAVGILNGIEETGRKCQVTVLTGKNRSLYRKIRHRVSAAPAGRLRVMPYVPSVEPYLTASDVLVTKAGGLSVAEAIARGLPIVLTGNLPGQERMNARLLCDDRNVSSARDGREAGRKAAQVAVGARKDIPKDCATSADIALELIGET